MISKNVKLKGSGQDVPPPEEDDETKYQNVLKYHTPTPDDYADRIEELEEEIENLKEY